MSIVIGRGWAFPLRRDPFNGRPAFSSEDERIKESIHSIIMTDIDERPFLVRNGVPYGTRISRVLFSPLQTVIDVATFDVKNALATWEPRILVRSVKAEQVTSNGMQGVVLTVRYVYRRDNRNDSYSPLLPWKGPQ